MSDEIMERIGTAVTRGREGDPAAARTLLAGLWEEATDAVQRCAIAHHAADVQESVAEELAWDLRALAVVPDPPDARFTGFLPSRATYTLASATWHRLSIAGISRREDAVKLCATVRAAGGACFVREAAGDAPIQWARRTPKDQYASAR